MLSSFNLKQKFAIISIPTMQNILAIKLAIVSTLMIIVYNTQKNNISRKQKQEMQMLHSDNTHRLTIVQVSSISQYYLMKSFIKLMYDMCICLYLNIHRLLVVYAIILFS